MDRPRRFTENSHKNSGVDLMIVDIPEGLPIPMFSSSIPSWNFLSDNFLDIVFDFASHHVHDDGALLLFHADDTQLTSKLKGFLKAYKFMIYKEWMGINRLRLTNAKDNSKTVCFLYFRFFFCLFNFQLL